MLNWWLGRPVEGKYLQDQNPEPDAPETPAPVFAARALKSALFGTPAPPDETIIEDDDTEETVVVSTPKPAKLHPRSLSPTKGILLTPGTATTRRKTVSFGHEVFEKEVKVETVKTDTKNGRPSSSSSSGQIPTPWVLDGESSVTRKTSLTRTLENAREGKSTKTVSGNNRTSMELDDTPLVIPAKESKDSLLAGPELKEPALPQPSAQPSSRPQRAKRESSREAAQPSQFNSDMTMDLNEPHSQSGKYWKSEYEQYHAAARSQMERLINYKVLAKSFAKMKDDEAIDLTQKLEEEQRKVIQMETKVTQLSEKIQNASPNGSDSSTEMVKDLARQTALAMQYRSEVESFRAAMEESCREETISVQRRIGSSTRPDGGDSRRAREQLREADALRREVKQLRQSLEAAEVKNAELQGENAKLTQDLLHSDMRHSTHLEKCDQRRDSFDGQLQLKDERFRSLQKEFDKFKDVAKKSRRDTEIILKKRHEQAVELRKEIASLRGLESTAQELKQVLHKQSLAHEEVVAHFQKKHEDEEVHQNYEELKPKVDEKSSITGSHTEKEANINTTPFKRDSQIPVLTSVSRPSRIAAPTKSIRSEPAMSIRPQPSIRALSEIVNGASIDAVPPEGEGPVKHTPVPVRIAPLDVRASSISPQYPDNQSPEPALPLHKSNRAIHERNCHGHASPRPSMFNIASSPPKAALVRPRAGELTKQRSSNYLGALPAPSMSVDTSRVRKEMAPDRLAAAKARLDQKKRMKDAEMQKENVRT